MTGLESLYTAVLSDVLDGLGRMDRAMAPHIRPLDDGLTFWGRARTARYEEVDGVIAVPAELAERAVALALEKVAGEDTTRAELTRGDLLADVFARHGVL